MKRPFLMRALLVLLAGLVACNTATAQTATDPNEGARLTHGSALGSYDFSWWGQPGRTYFIQHSDNLSAWEYLPLIESGTDALRAWGFTSTASKFFLRLRFSDIATSDPFTADFDGDKVGNYDELLFGTDPLVSLDSDFDGLPDDWERWHLGNLLSDGSDDADGDGLLNLEEFLHSTNPNSTDSDYDGLSDGDEVHTYSTDPLLPDTDGDWMPDGWEVAHGLNPLLDDAAGDLDSDGLPNLYEYWYGTNPQLADTDGDGLNDGDEVHLYFTRPLIADTDGDGLSDGAEVAAGTNPNNPDTDGDGVTDGEEVDNNTDPNSDQSHPPVWRVIYRTLQYDFDDYPENQGGRHGWLTTSGSWTGSGGGTVTLSAEIGWPALSGRLASEAAFPATKPAITGGLTSTYGYARLLPNPPCYHATLLHARVWLEVKPAATEPIIRKLPKVTERSIDGESSAPVVEIVEVTIPAGQTLSPPTDLVPAFTTNPADNQAHSETVGMNLLPVDIVPDFNRDGVIDDKDRGKVSDTEPWRWWINDDDDNGEEAHDDVPRGAGSANRDSANQTVDGSCDLLDFFPVYFDIKKLLEVLPPDQAEYRLVHTQAAVKFAYTDLTAGEAGNYFRDASVAEALKGAATIEVPAAGVALTADFLNKIKNEDGKGVLIFEGAAVSNNPSSVEPLKLEVRKGGQKIAEVKFPLKLDSVEKMYRWINLRDKANSGPVARPTDVTTEPPNRPDRLTTDKHFVFVHGYSVTETDAKGWNAEIFKRLYQSGMRAKFTAVTWRGDQGKITGTLAPSWLQGATPDYWENVTNAFLTSPHLATAANALSGTKLIAGHSLGNMVVSSAIKDHALSVSKYFMLDAAVALEAYDSSMQNKRAMSDYEWSSTLGGSYPDHLWSAYWGNQFPTNDGRNKLTWRERFGVLPSAINFYSSGEEVLDNWFAPPLLPLPGSLNAWNKQELLKGTFLGSLLTAARQGGWGFNTAWDKEDRTQPQNPDGNYPKVRRANNVVADITPVMVKIKPFFIPFADARLHDLAQGSAAANEYNVRAKTLAEGIPSLSFAAGRNAINGFDATDNRDLMDFRTKVNGTPVWPRGNNKNWLHSDIKEVAFRYNWAAYEEIINMGQLK